jgi:ElaB/YqjD/DUF883 family membrane-anchored ribosome-binding protein
VAEEPSVIREEIERTRERLDEKADALAYKADVPARTKERVIDVRDNVVSKVNEATPSVDQVKNQFQTVQAWVRSNPAPAALIALCVGVLIGGAILGRSRT